MWTAACAGRGIGGWLVARALEHARKRGCRLAQLTSDKRRTDAHRFYTRLGFTDSHLGYKRVLEDGECQRFTLESLNEGDKPFGDLQALLLDGPTLADAHFNLKERRNAASVHLAYPVAEGTDVAAFYCEVTAGDDRSPPSTWPAVGVAVNSGCRSTA